jgi:hypothetical protein
LELLIQVRILVSEPIAPTPVFLPFPPIYANWLIFKWLGLTVGAWSTPCFPRLLCQRFAWALLKAAHPPKAPPAGPLSERHQLRRLRKLLMEVAETPSVANKVGLLSKAFNLAEA